MGTNERYHKTVWEEAKKEAKSYIGTDRRLLVGNIVLAVSSGFATSRLLDYWSKTTMIPPIIQVITILAGAIIGFCLLYVWHLGLSFFWFIPAKMYREKEIQVWWRTWHDVEIKEIRFQDKNWFGFGLSVISDKPDGNTIHIFYPKIVKILQGNEEVYSCGTENCGIEIPTIFREFQAGSFFQRRDGINTSNRKEVGESTLAIHVAYFKDNLIVIKGKIEKEGEQPKQYEQQINLPCQLTIILNGRMGIKKDPTASIEMDECKILCEINEDKENDFSINMRRSPNYEYK